MLMLAYFDTFHDVTNSWSAVQNIFYSMKDNIHVYFWLHDMKYPCPETSVLLFIFHSHTFFHTLECGVRSQMVYRVREAILISTWWRHQMETFSVLLALCAGNSPVTGEFPAQRPVTRSFGVFFDLRLNKRLSNNRNAGDLRRHHAHHDITLWFSKTKLRPTFPLVE